MGVPDAVIAVVVHGVRVEADGSAVVTAHVSSSFGDEAMMHIDVSQIRSPREANDRIRSEARAIYNNLRGDRGGLPPTVLVFGGLV